jgi:glucose-6-phosphate dehydrogenase assembly protein OpcA
MAPTLTDRAWRPSTPERIEADLTALWEDLGRETPVSRAAMSNLVVFCLGPAREDVDPESEPEGVPVDAVSSHHPARVILLRHDPNVTSPAHAQVGVRAFGPADARYGIEHIVVRSSCDEAALPSIIRPLLLGDMPTSIWWAEDFSSTPPLTSLVTMGRQLLYDSRQWHDVRSAVLAVVPFLSETFGPDLADVNWRRLTPLRQALVHALESSAGARHQPTSIRIRHRPGESALAWLLAGWLQDAFEPPISVEEQAVSGDTVLSLAFDDGLELRLGPHSVSVDDALGPAPFSVSTPQESEVEALAAELRVLTHDAPFHRALAALARRFVSA